MEDGRYVKLRAEAGLDKQPASWLPDVSLAKIGKAI